MAQNVIQLPNRWQPRPDQMPFWSYMERGGLRADVVAHRRFGKDDVSLHFAATAAHKRIGVYWHMLPEAAQARKAIWDAVNPRTGKRRIDEAFPKELRAATREQDMLIRFKNGSTWQVLGSDNYDSFVGSPPIGVVFSEWSLAKPHAWTYIRPILLENGGWAVFIWTPRGRNHATRAWEARAQSSDWYTAKIDATMTPVFTPEQLAKELHELQTELGSREEGQAKYDSEYMVSFDAAVPGAYFASAILESERKGRVGKVEFNPRFKVDTAWDLGIDDYTSIWFFQRISPIRVNIIGYYETSDLGLDQIVKEAFKDPPERQHWSYGMHYLPHDVKVRELGAGGKSRKQTLVALGISNIRVGVPNDPEERINATRRALPHFYFDQEATQVGLEHLKQHRKRWNESLRVYTGELHGEHSHAAHAIGEFAVNAHFGRIQSTEEAPKPKEDRWSRFRRPLGQPRGWKTA